MEINLNPKLVETREANFDITLDGNPDKVLQELFDLNGDGEWDMVVNSSPDYNSDGKTDIKLIFSRYGS